MAQSDAELIKRTLDGDDYAFGFLVEKYKGAVHALAYRKIGDFHIAEDITQDTFLKAYQKLSTLKRHANFSGWLYVIAARRCISWLRNNKHPMQSLERVGAAQVEASAEREYSDDRVRKRLHDALENLPESDRTVLTLHYLGGMTYDEVSRFIGASTSAVKNRLYRARHHLKEELIKMIHQTWGTHQLPPTFTQQLVEKICRLNPAPAPGSKPQAPWITAITLGVAALVVVVGMLSTSEFQQPYSLNPTTPVKVVELTEAPIVETHLPKPSFTNHSDGDGNPVLALSAGAGDTKQVDTPRGDISGRVIYAGTGKPAADVPILAFALQSSIEKLTVGHTREDGVYILKNMRPGLYTVMIGDTVRGHATFDWRAPAHEGINVKPAETYTEVNFRLTTGAIIEGRVTDGDTGQPLEGMLIRVYDATHPPRMGIGHSLTTNEHGQYRMRVASGPVSIFIMTSNTGYYIEDAESPREYSEEIKENETQSELDFICHLGNNIHGFVQTEDFEPVVGATVVPHDDAPFHVRTGTDSEGRFTLKGVPRNIESAVITAQYNDYDLYGDVEWNSNQAGPLTITVGRQISATIGGRVIDGTGKPVGGAGIGLNRETDVGMNTLVPFTQTDSDGSFTVGPKTPLNSLKIGKRHRLYATAEGYGMVSSDWFALQEGFQSLPDLVLPGARFYVAGQVVDWRGHPVGAAYVSIDDTDTHTAFAHTISDVNGKFRVENISAPRVHIFAHARGYHGSDQGLVYEANRDDLRVVLSPEKPMIRDEAGNTIPYHRHTFPHPLEDSDAPELKVDRWFNTEPIALSSLRGKVVVLNFWSALESDPETCAVWFPALNRIHDQYSDKGVVVIGIHRSADLQHHDDIQAAIDREEIRFPIGIAKKAKTKIEEDVLGIYGATFKDYAVRGILPAIYFVDKAGKVRTLFLIGGTLDEKVNALLNE